MTQSEFRFRSEIKKLFNDPNIYIRKVPDKKITGLGTTMGLPDYIVITNGITYWFEVKMSNTKTTFNLSLISESQYIEFTKMRNAGAQVIIAIYVDNKLYLINYGHIFNYKFVQGKKSLTLEELYPYLRK
jgi:penicillin-binding protein-related factor A (putative recombinase)